jgi:hypothetical protein
MNDKKNCPMALEHLRLLSPQHEMHVILWHARWKLLTPAWSDLIHMY